MKLTQQQAAYFAALPLHGLTREYPNHIMHLMQNEADAQTPRQLHPVFYGCYDWHSAVHGFWLLARCVRLFPDLPERAQIEALFTSHFTAEAFLQETHYFQADGRASFERPYGWGWLLGLAHELNLATSPALVACRDAMQPLVTEIRSRFLSFLPKQHYPIRVGTHFNTAFALILARDYAVCVKDHTLLSAIDCASRDYYGKDVDYPAKIEPNGDDFLSGALTEALLMSRVFAPSEFAAWFQSFLPNLATQRNLLNPVTVSDRTDPKIAHLDGLNLSRAWCMREIAAQLPQTAAALEVLQSSATAHLAASLPHVASGDYVGEHWLATFAMLAVNMADEA